MLEQEAVYNENVRTVTSEAVGFRGSELYDITSGHICNTYAGYGPSHFFMRKKEMEEIDETANPDSFDALLQTMKDEEANPNQLAEFAEGKKRPLASMGGPAPVVGAPAEQDDDQHIIRKDPY